MPSLSVNLQLDITPKTKLTIPGDGKVSVQLNGEVDVPEPLFAQQIWDSVRDVVEAEKNRLQKSFKKGEKSGWGDSEVQKAISESLDNIGNKANKAVRKTVKELASTNETYSIVKKQDVAKVALSTTSIALNITRLVISGGTDIMAWACLGKSLYDSANYLYNAVKDIEKVDKETRKKVGKAEKYYRSTVMAGKETVWNKFCTLFSDPLSKSTTATGDMTKRLARAEKPCHDMAKVAQGLLELQDKGENSKKVEKKLDKLLTNISDTMAKVTPAKKSLEKMKKELTALESDLKKFKGKDKSMVSEIMKKDGVKKISKRCSSLKKYADDNAVSDWCDAASNLATLGKELAALF
jgi:hypothetical protein